VNGRSARRAALRLLPGAAALVGVSAAGLALHYMNEVRVARRETPALISAALDRYGAELGLADLPPEREAALLAVHDPAFRRHRGVDLSTPGAGMTTLTQALVKQLYFPEGFRPGVAKIRQTLIAQYVLDRAVSKDEQLALFLNLAYLGHEAGEAVHGFAAASESYFGTSFGELTDDEFLALVAMLINPNALKPHTPANRERVERIRRYVTGDYRPEHVMDLEYRGAPSDPKLAVRGLMALLRVLTDAAP
jgi:membrane peptidoglycan carboxypeptidase